MTHDPQSSAHLFTQVDIAAGSQPTCDDSGDAEPTELLRQMLSALDRQNELLEELIAQQSAAQRQRAAELKQWKEANPDLARGCRLAAEGLSRVQTEFLTALTAEVNENAEELRDSDFLLTEFVDRFGPRLAHLNGVLQVLSQLGSAGATTTSSNQT